MSWVGVAIEKRGQDARAPNLIEICGQGRANGLRQQCHMPVIWMVETGDYLGTGRLEPRDFFFSSRRRHTRCLRDWSSDVCSSDLDDLLHIESPPMPHPNLAGRVVRVIV